MTAPTPRDRGRPAPTGAANPRLANLLVATALGTYLLVVVGAATTLLDGATACPTWPTCGGAWLPTDATPGLLAAWGHRLATLVVGGSLAATAWVARRSRAPRRVQGALLAAVLLYPGQVWLGALTATGGGPVGLSSAHLVAGVTIFSATLVALLWQLEAATGATPDDPPGQSPQGPRPGPSTPGPSASTDERRSAAGTPDDAVPGGTLAVLRRRAGAYVRLTKPKLWWLLCLVAAAAMGLAAGPDLALGTVVPTMVGGVLAIGASGTFNNVLERDADERMRRTDDRPLVEGTVPLGRAVAFGLALTAASIATFLAFVNALAAALGLLAVLFYSVVYTVLLKPRTDQNVVVGGAVGAFPALIGWAAVTGTVEVPALVLGTVVFLWTPAHFYNLALAYRADYARAGFPMLPVVRGAAAARRHVLLYFGATMLAGVALGTATRLDWLYAGVVVALAAVFLRELVGQYRTPTDRTALRTFHASNAYLGALLAAVVVDATLL